MKKIVLILLTILLAVSCSAPYLVPYQFTYNPFIYNTKWIEGNEQYAAVLTSSLSFSIITDSHFGKKGSSEWFNDNYLAFLNEKKYPFALHLGDLTDTGEITDEDYAFIDKVRAATTVERKNKDGNVISTGFVTIAIGNHDRHTTADIWDSENGGDTYSTAQRYYYGKTSSGKPLLAIYKLDTSADCISYKQFYHLESALKSETAQYRIIITHENVSIGNRLSPTMVIFGLSSEEGNKLYKIMSKYNVGLILDGHNHSGNIVYKLNDTLGEMNLAAYMRKITKPIQTESYGYWYDFTLDIETGVVTITGYLAQTGEKDENVVFSFNLPKCE